MIVLPRFDARCKKPDEILAFRLRLTGHSPHHRVPLPERAFAVKGVLVRSFFGSLFERLFSGFDAGVVVVVLVRPSLSSRSVLRVRVGRSCALRPTAPPSIPS